MDLSGRVIPEFSLTQNRYSEYALVKPKTGWFIHDNHLYVVNNKVLETILLNALFDNPDDIHQVNCANNVDGSCSDYMDEQFPIDSDLIDDMYKMSFEMLVKSRILPIDIENNAKDVETSRRSQ